jgi:hypothetical protein
MMIYYLSSIPRSGSTLLASLLSQRDDVYVSPTSNLGETLGAVVNAFENSQATKAGECSKEELHRTLKGVVDAKYSDRKESVIFDKGRTWPDPQIMETMGKAMGEVKIVATVRPMAECIASFYEIDKSDLPIKEWIKTSQLYSHLMISYTALKDGYEKHPEQFCIIEYDNLCSNPQKELNRVADFLNIPHVSFSPSIKQVAENDNAWGVKDLHTLGSTIKKTEQDARQVLGDTLFELYQGGEFWNEKPEPIRVKKPIDLALEAGLHGKFSKGYDILKKEQSLYTEDNRIAFNLGWYEMQKGNLRKGHELINRGREEDVFGNPPLSTDKPIWDGQKGVTVLLNLEGGQGDQFHCVRYAQNLKEDYNCSVIVACSSGLADVICSIEDVVAVVNSETAMGVHFDYWLPAMSANIPLRLEYSDLSGKPYIPRLCQSENKVGIKWSGNPMFEHEQHRHFPSELMFNAVNDEDCLCLQKDMQKNKGTDDLEEIPEWMEMQPLDTWKQTREQISRCDLVISSCTSVAHLAGAMGIETWIIVPILPYYLWALHGNKTPYYDSVTLYRQEKYGCWKAPFKKIKQDLIARRVASWGKLSMGETTRLFIEA